MRSNKEIALDAIDLVTPAILKLFERTNRKELHIVVMDPSLKAWESAFDNAILVEKSLGTPKEWTIQFDHLARKKAHQAWRNGCANLDIQSKHPSSLQDDDILFYGSFVYGNIVVACSGVEQHYDMLMSSWIALAFEQLTVAEYTKSKTDTPTKAFR
ncbi:hypothetical protein DS885_12545 [Psychromonas sp. B3M02]|uniref:hypothetical protein n=1 Tax=Psychromonas sp. B3M02 TaxID=2267226 RepID=UPI000DE9AA54|nr:hypothetical protein [Psychromonas sp. B3M02]RBW43939.1 hypothetical protein DS885_12545 [Psychromonas sp. B3M02]